MSLVALEALLLTQWHAILPFPPILKTLASRTQAYFGACEADFMIRSAACARTCGFPPCPPIVTANASRAAASALRSAAIAARNATVIPLGANATRPAGEHLVSWVQFSHPSQVQFSHPSHVACLILAVCHTFAQTQYHVPIEQTIPLPWSVMHCTIMNIDLWIQPFTRGAAVCSSVPASVPSTNLSKSNAVAIRCFHSAKYWAALQYRLLPSPSLLD